METQSRSPQAATAHHHPAPATAASNGTSTERLHSHEILRNAYAKTPLFFQLTVQNTKQANKRAIPVPSI